MYNPLLEHLNRLGDSKTQALKKLLSKTTPLFTVAETATLTNTSHQLWYRLIHMGEIQAYKVANRIQIPLEEICTQVSVHPPKASKSDQTDSSTHQ